MRRCMPGTCARATDVPPLAPTLAPTLPPTPLPPTLPPSLPPCRELAREPRTSPARGSRRGVAGVASRRAAGDRRGPAIRASGFLPASRAGAVAREARFCVSESSPASRVGAPAGRTPGGRVAPGFKTPPGGLPGVAGAQDQGRARLSHGDGGVAGDARILAYARDALGGA